MRRLPLWDPWNYEKERWEKMLEEREASLKKEEEDLEKRKLKAGRLKRVGNC